MYSVISIKTQSPPAAYFATKGTLSQVFAKNAYL